MTAPSGSRLLLLAAGLAGAVFTARLLPARDPGEPRIPAGEFQSASAAGLSFDGGHLVFSGRRVTDGVTGIWEMAIGDVDARLVTRGNGAPADPVYLPDGRILYSDAIATDRVGSLEPRALFSCRDDGTEPVRLTYGAHVDGGAAVLPDGRIGFTRRYDPPISGRASIRMTIHPDGTQVSFAGDRSGSIGRGADAGLPRVRPPVLTSVVNAERATGTLLCLDVYASRLPGITALPRGAIRSVVVTPADEGPGAASLGEAPVHADGSFFVEVPADRALRLTLLDEARRPLASLDSGIWVRRNENRGCIGCHEEPDLAPENRRPLAIAEPPVALPASAPTSGVTHVP